MAPNTISFESCMPVKEHGRQIMSWRNDPETRAASYNTAEKTWDTFWPEYTGNYFSKPDCPGPWFALTDGKRAGFVGLQPEPHPKGLRGKCVNVSFHLASEFRGQGLASRILQATTGLACRHGVASLYAEIRQGNDASLKAFSDAGYISIGDGEKHIAATGETVRIHRLLVEAQAPFWREGRVKVIAEAGSNWRMGTAPRDLAMAKSLIDVAVDAGADFVKFQTYRPETTYVANAGASDYLSDAGIKSDISEIFADLAMPYEMIGELSDYCRSQEIGFMSTPFSKADFEAIDPFVDVHKIASYEISHPHLLRLAGTSGKPLVLSTGASGEADIAWAVETFYKAGGQNLCLLQCTSKYPAPLETLNLSTISWIMRRFGVVSGLSDHSLDPVAGPAAAVALGASVIEKHYTLDKRLPGPDHPFALEPGGLKKMVQAIRDVEQTLGTGAKTVQAVEDELAAFARRGIQAIRRIEPGEALTEGDAFEILRPGKNRLGAHPRHICEIEGRPANRTIELGDGIYPADCQPRTSHGGKNG